MSKQDTHIELAPDLRISRIVTGLWQIADMERDNKVLDLDLTARSMKAYSQAGLTTFDMADHYGSAEKIAGIFTNRYAEGDDVQVLTKWVPKPGGSSQDDRSASRRTRTATAADGAARFIAIPRLELCRPELPR